MGFPSQQPWAFLLSNHGLMRGFRKAGQAMQASLHSTGEQENNIPTRINIFLKGSYYPFCLSKLQVFFGFLHFRIAWKGWLRYFGRCLQRCWLEDGILRRTFAHVGARMANKRSKMVSKNLR